VIFSKWKLDATIDTEKEDKESQHDQSTSCQTRHIWSRHIPELRHSVRSVSALDYECWRVPCAGDKTLHCHVKS